MIAGPNHCGEGPVNAFRRESRYTAGDDGGVMGEKLARQCLPMPQPDSPRPVPSPAYVPEPAARPLRIARPWVDEEIEYPSSDGKPMAESGPQRQVMIEVHEGLRLYLQERRDDFVLECDLLIYYEERNPKASVAPDIFVVLGVPGGKRLTYLLWKEGKPPDFVLEVASSSTYQHDNDWKAALYARLGVREYWQFDVKGGLLDPRLKAGRLVSGAYEPLQAIPSPVGELWMYSEVLGVQLRFDGGSRLLVWDPYQERYLSTDHEKARADDAARRAEGESIRAAEAERKEMASRAELLEERRLREELQAHVDRLMAARSQYK